jgi:hypothetical protein
MYGMPSAGGIQMGVKDNQGQDLGYIDPSKAPVSSVGQADPYFKQASDAYYQQAASRLDPQWQSRQSDLEAQLENMGLSRGSEAWDREMQGMGRSRNDAYDEATRQSILTGGAEAQRMQGMDIASGNFANQAAQQNFMNQFQSQKGAMDLGSWNNAQQQQQFNQNQASAQLNNDALKNQQQIAQGWGGLQNQLDIGEMNARAAEAGAAAAGSSANAQMALQSRQMEMGNALNSRQMQDAERLQDYNMAKDMRMQPYIEQNLAMGGMGPDMNQDWANYGQSSPTMGTVNSSDYGKLNQSAQETSAKGMGSMGGGLIGGFASMFGLG